MGSAALMPPSVRVAVRVSIRLTVLAGSYWASSRTPGLESRGVEPSPVRWGTDAALIFCRAVRGAELFDSPVERGIRLRGPGRPWRLGRWVRIR